jgi:hypothetical protein
MQQGLPVHGYVDQPQKAIDMVNVNKVIEERILRIMDEMRDAGHQYDQRWLAIARTDIERGFMALNRAIFRPQRVTLTHMLGDDPV